MTMGLQFRGNTQLKRRRQLLYYSLGVLITVFTIVHVDVDISESPRFKSVQEGRSVLARRKLLAVEYNTCQPKSCSANEICTESPHGVYCMNDDETHSNSIAAKSDVELLCHNKHPQCEERWKVCCPGQRGASGDGRDSLCSPVDCEPTRKPGKPCLGIWMMMHCKALCGLCNRSMYPDIVLSKDTDMKEQRKQAMLKNSNFISVSQQFTDSVTKIIPKIVLNGTKTVIVVTVSSGYVEFFINWQRTASSIGYNKFLIIAEDTEAFEALKHDEEFATSLVLSPTPVIDSDADAISYKSHSYNSLVSNRPRYLRLMLELGLDVLYCDVDAVWIDDPLQDIVGNFDIWIQSDADSPDDYPYHMLCTGFMFIKSNKRSKELILNWEYELSIQSETTVNQEIFNRLARKAMLYDDIRIRALDFSRFPSGMLTYGYPLWMSMQKVKPAVIHNNFMVGREAKKNGFISIGRWFVD